jgi:hypothetical protein
MCKETFKPEGVAARAVNRLSPVAFPPDSGIFFSKVGTPKQIAFGYTRPGYEKEVDDGVMPYHFGVLAYFKTLKFKFLPRTNAFIDLLGFRAGSSQSQIVLD